MTDEATPIGSKVRQILKGQPVGNPPPKVAEQHGLAPTTSHVPPVSIPPNNYSLQGITGEQASHLLTLELMKHAKHWANKFNNPAITILKGVLQKVKAGTPPLENFDLAALSMAQQTVDLYASSTYSPQGKPAASGDLLKHIAEFHALGRQYGAVRSPMHG